VGAGAGAGAEEDEEERGAPDAWVGREEHAASNLLEPGEEETSLASMGRPDCGGTTAAGVEERGADDAWVGGEEHAASSLVKPGEEGVASASTGSPDSGGTTAVVVVEEERGGPDARGGGDEHAAPDLLDPGREGTSLASMPTPAESRRRVGGGEGEGEAQPRGRRGKATRPRLGGRAWFACTRRRPKPPVPHSLSLSGPRSAPVGAWLASKTPPPRRSSLTQAFLLFFLFPLPILNSNN
jgi:hypothetical protein